MLIEHILHRKGHEVETIPADAPVADAVVRLRERNIGALVVTDPVGGGGNGENDDSSEGGDAGSTARPIAGILSERDIVRALAEHGAATLTMPVSEFMTGPVIHCTEDDDLERVIELMREHRIRHLPVLDSGRMVGIVTVTDVLQFYLEGRFAGNAAAPAG